MDNLNVIEARVKAATQGPWTQTVLDVMAKSMAGGPEQFWGHKVLIEAHGGFVDVCTVMDACNDAPCGHDGTHFAEKTADFIAHARTDTAWWHDNVNEARIVRFLRGRVHFGGMGPAPFPSAVVVFGD